MPAHVEGRTCRSLPFRIAVYEKSIRAITIVGIACRFYEPTTGQVLINGHAPDNPKAEQTLKPGDLVEVLLPGGGGYGPPAERDPGLRQRDLQQGYVFATNGSATGR